MANPPAASPTGPTAAARPTAEKTRDQLAQNDLKTGRTKRTIDAGPLRVAVEYQLRRKVEDWEPGQSQPLTVTMSVLDTAVPSQKVYLSQVVIYQDVSDGRGHVDSPTPLSDRANIVPGYLVDRPATYTQVFVLPALPGDASQLTLDVRYEMLSLQQGAERDYAKISTTDTVVITKS